MPSIVTATPSDDGERLAIPKGQPVRTVTHYEAVAVVAKTPAFAPVAERSETVESRQAEDERLLGLPRQHHQALALPSEPLAEEEHRNPDAVLDVSGGPDRSDAVGIDRARPVLSKSLPCHHRSPCVNAVGSWGILRCTSTVNDSTAATVSPHAQHPRHEHTPEGTHDRHRGMGVCGRISWSGLCLAFSPNSVT